MTEINGETQDLFAEDIAVDALDNEVAAGFATAASAASAGSASCPAASVSTAGSFSSVGN
ncbi:thiocillin family RiPP [Gulosibacter faecalis]|jgi:hypothetical protein|uniref:Thiocillin family RiPP n=1 Tax=Gulosibacter faecalis TaxID=272240 RepID=A0ABW5UV51_9MICO|nr:thiocillin family RiPP [Gulosibacter faecalis]